MADEPGGSLSRRVTTTLTLFHYYALSLLFLNSLYKELRKSLLQALRTIFDWLSLRVTYY